MLFKEFFHKAQLSIGGTKRRHRNPLGTTDMDRHYRRKSLNIVPKMYQADLNKNQKIETLKTRPGKFICDQKDIDYITKTFLQNRPPNKFEHKTLGGKMGINFYYDQPSGKWIIEKR